jgi:hypothetical protein
MRVCGFCDNPDVTQEHARAEGGMKTFRAELERGDRTASFPKSDLEITGCDVVHGLRT